MPRPKRWTYTEFKDGLMTVTLASWKYFADFINQELLDYKTYIYRGHASDAWKLESTLDRAIKVLPTAKRSEARGNHLANFRLAARGRRGPNPRELTRDEDWWALGQHYGLATPLLDWTESPFVALYFAFEQVDTRGASYRAVWGISQNSATSRSLEILSEWKDAETNGRPPIVQIIRPMLDENPRLVSQRGVFVWGPDDVPIDDWFQQQYPAEPKLWRAFKIKIPRTDRPQCLRFLNRMNINHLSLFPDLSGASLYCNMDLQIDNY